MVFGKYSPTVSMWYMRDQKWHERHCEPDEWIDRDGYDSYGYHHKTRLDRAGYTEYDYLADGKWVDQGLPTEAFVYDLYDIVLADWCTRALPWEK